MIYDSAVSRIPVSPGSPHPPLGASPVAESPSLFEYSKVPPGDPLLLEVFRLRYKVYVEEWGFERSEDHPGGMERDAYDDHSVHFVVRRTGEEHVIGTVRMIVNSECGFPIEKHCTLERDLSVMNREGFGEISRLAISKEYRRRTTDSVYRDREPLTPELFRRMYGGQRRLENDIVLGLYRCICMESLERGNEYLLAVMARGLVTLLRRVGIVFDAIGPEQNYHGLRAPYLGRVETMLEELSRRNPGLYARFMG